MPQRPAMGESAIWKYAKSESVGLLPAKQTMDSWFGSNWANALAKIGLNLTNSSTVPFPYEDSTTCEGGQE
jgi:hypothetical protein